MRQPLFEIQLHLLVQASQLGLWPESDAQACELGILASRGLVRADCLGCYFLSSLGALVLASNILGRRGRGPVRTSSKMRHRLPPAPHSES